MKTFAFLLALVALAGCPADSKDTVPPVVPDAGSGSGSADAQPDAAPAVDSAVDAPDAA